MAVVLCIGACLAAAVHNWPWAAGLTAAQVNFACVGSVYSLRAAMEHHRIRIREAFEMGRSAGPVSSVSRI